MSSFELEQETGYPISIMIADGWNRDAFKALLAKGDLPAIQESIIDEGCLIDDVVSNVPSVSIASHASIRALDSRVKSLVVTLEKQVLAQSS